MNYNEMQELDRKRKFERRWKFSAPNKQDANRRTAGQDGRREMMGKT